MTYTRNVKTYSTKIQELALCLFSTEKMYELWFNVYNQAKDSWNRDREMPKPLYFVALGGLRNIATELVRQGADINAQGGKSGNALQAASLNGDKEVVEMLLQQGAEVNAEGGQYSNALQAASFRGPQGGSGGAAAAGRGR
jgi:ankyrin repeat protein